MTTTRIPLPPPGAHQVSPDTLEAIAFARGRTIEVPESEGWARLDVDGVRYIAWLPVDEAVAR